MSIHDKAFRCLSSCCVPTLFWLRQGYNRASASRTQCCVQITCIVGIANFGVSCNHSLHHPVLLPRRSTAAASSRDPDAVQWAASVTELQEQDTFHSDLKTLQSPSTSSSDLDTADVQQHSGSARRRSRSRKHQSQESQAEFAEQVINCLVQQAQLPKALAEHVVTTLIKGTPGMPSQPKEVCRRVRCLQELLGVDNALMALKRSPYLVAYR